MGFKGTAPAPDVVTIVKVGGRDFYLWPGAQGEDMPPTLGGSATYSRAGTVAAAVPAYSLGSAGAISWPAFGSLGPDPAKTVPMMQVDILFPNPAAGPVVYFGFGGNTGGGFPQVNAPWVGVNPGSLLFYASSNTVTTYALAADQAAALSGGAWATITLRAPGPVLINGRAAMRSNGTPVPPLEAPASWAALATAAPLAANGAGASNAYLRNVYATWEAPAVP